MNLACNLQFQQTFHSRRGLNAQWVENDKFMTPILPHQAASEFSPRSRWYRKDESWQRSAKFLW